MIVASSNGTISLPGDFSDPLCCTYVCGDTALDPAEIKGKHAHRSQHSNVHWPPRRYPEPGR